MTYALANPFMAEAPVGAPEPFSQIVSELEAALAENNRWDALYDEDALLAIIMGDDPPPLFLQRAAE